MCNRGLRQGPGSAVVAAGWLALASASMKTGRLTRETWIILPLKVRLLISEDGFYITRQRSRTLGSAGKVEKQDS
jgi:hypothetical protein